MNSKKVGSSSTSVTNTPQYHPPGGGDPENRVSTSSAKPWSINHFDFSDEPQELSDTTNLSTFCERRDTSQTKSAPSQLQFDSESSVDDGSRDADSASEESDPVTPPANTPPGPAQPTVQLSDDPAIAALQKSQLAIAAAVVLYSTCLAIFENAIADPQSKLPPNSFSYLRSMFSGAIKESEARALDLKTQFTQLLTQHSEEAKALAAQAERGTSPVSVDTFSTKPGPVGTPVDWKQVRQEVKQLPTQAQQDQVVEGLRVALQQMDPVSDADLDRELRQLLWDIDPMEGVDPELVEFHKQLQEEEVEPSQQKVDKEIKALGRDAYALNNFKFPDDGVDPDWYEFEPHAAPLNKTGPETTLPTQTFFDEVDELLQDLNQTSLVSTTNKSTSTHTASQPVDISAELDALLAELGDGAPTPPHDSQPSPANFKHDTEVTDEDRMQAEKNANDIILELTSGTPMANQLAQSAPAKVKSSPTSAQNDELKKLIADAHVPKIDEWSKAANEIAAVLRSLDQVLTRELTNDEKAIKNRFTAHGGTEEAYRQALQKEFLKNSIQAQSQVIDSVGNELKAIESGTAMLNATLEQKKVRVIELKQQMFLAVNQRKTLLNTKL